MEDNGVGMLLEDDDPVPGGKTTKRILDTLTKYGDSLLDDDAHKATQRRKKKRKIVLNSIEPTSIQNEPAKTKRKRKKKKSTSISDKDGSSKTLEDIEDKDSDSIDNQLHGEQKHLEQLKEKLGLTDVDFLKSIEEKRKKENHTEKYTQQQMSVSKDRGKRPPPEIIVFEDPAKRNQNKEKKNHVPAIQRRQRIQSEDSDSETDMGQMSDLRQKDPVDPNLFDMRRAKHDVQMFGITGMQKVDKEKARLDVLLKLGAKQPKNKYVNYKQFQDVRKKEKSEQKIQREVERAMGNKVSKTNIRKQRQRDRNDVGLVDGQIGKYKHGVQVINKKEIYKVKTSSNTRRRR